MFCILLSLSGTLNLTVNVHDSRPLPGLISPGHSARFPSIISVYQPHIPLKVGRNPFPLRPPHPILFSHPCSVSVLCVARCKTSSGCRLRARNPTPLGGRTHLRSLKLEAADLRNVSGQSWPVSGKRRVFGYNMKEVRSVLWKVPERCRRLRFRVFGQSQRKGSGITRRAHAMQPELSSHSIPLFLLTFKADPLDSLNRMNDAGWKR